jgi:hypothetical protein
MTADNSIDKWQATAAGEKIVLALMPFGVPLMPPLGISCLKVYLQQHGYTNVKTVNLLVAPGVQDEYDAYFDTLRRAFTGDKESVTGNYYYDRGHNVLNNHMMAYLNYKDEEKYIQLVRQLVYTNFYITVDEPLARKLHGVVEKLYNCLESLLVRLLRDEKPAVLGLSVSRDGLPASLFAFRLTRERYPHTRTVMGGSVFFDHLAPGTAGFELFLERTRNDIDRIIIGEGELLLLKLLQGKLPGKQRVYTGRDIDGEILDLSTAGIPDFSDFDLSYFPYLGAYTSRSCPFQCSFCVETMGWGKYRKKSAGQVAAELQELHRRHGRQLYFMGDSLLNPVITPLAGELAAAGLSLYWDGYLRVDRHACDREKTMLWRRGGFYRARMGLESGSRRVLESMDKQITVEQTKKAVSALAYAGIKTTTFWVVGHPGETEEDFQLTLNLLETLKDDLYEAFCIPFTYNPVGQSKSDEWQQTNTPIPLYPEDAMDMLFVQAWTMDCRPSREEAHQRCLRFIRHLKKLGIPYPHLFPEVIAAEERWKWLHENAVPSQAEFMNRSDYLEENKFVRELTFLKSTIRDNSDFNF